jgi:hypothetical protein
MVTPEAGMPTTFVEFRGQDVAIAYQALDPDPDTGACPVDWWFADAAMRDTAPTEAEDRAIRGRLDEILCEPPPGWRDGGPGP